MLNLSPVKVNRAQSWFTCPDHSSSNRSFSGAFLKVYTHTTPDIPTSSTVAVLQQSCDMMGAASNRSSRLKSESIYLSTSKPATLISDSYIGLLTPLFPYVPVLGSRILNGSQNTLRYHWFHLGAQQLHLRLPPTSPTAGNCYPG